MVCCRIASPPPPGKIGDYRLSGPQVEPAASFWVTCPRPQPITIQELTPLTDRVPTPGNSNPFYVPPYPTDPKIVADEFAELLCMQSCRDDWEELTSPYDARHLVPPGMNKPDDCTTRCPISFFLQLRPQPIGAVYNFARGDLNFPVIFTPRELARYFEDETPGIAHRHALNYMIRDTRWSPPRQAWMWAVLDVTLYSALSAVWYYKWLAGQGVAGTTPRPNVSFRERPAEYAIANGLYATPKKPNGFTVIYDTAVNSTGSGDGARRRDFPPNAKYIEQSPGTPRHPAYPSGHSTYSAAASEILAFFFPDYRRELDFLAENAGMARLWAGVHWRSDHDAGRILGRAVACRMIEQLRGLGIPFLPEVPDCNQTPPSPKVLQQQGNTFAQNCGKNTVTGRPGLRCDFPPRCP